MNDTTKRSVPSWQRAIHCVRASVAQRRIAATGGTYGKARGPKRHQDLQFRSAIAEVSISTRALKCMPCVRKIQNRGTTKKNEADNEIAAPVLVGDDDDYDDDEECRW